MEIKIVTSSSIGKDDFNTKLIKDTILNFPNLSDVYKRIVVLISNNFDIKEGFYERYHKKIFGSILKRLKNGIPELSCTQIPPVGCIMINLDEFLSFPEWKKLFSIRHECCHLTHPRDSIILERLKGVYDETLLKNFVRFRREYLAHLCTIKMYPQDWLRNPMGLKETIMSPTKFYKYTKRIGGIISALQDAIANSIHILSFIYLYEHIPNPLKYKLGNRTKSCKKHLSEFFLQIQKDTYIKVLEPQKWLTAYDFFCSEKYCKKIESILFDVISNRKSLN